MVIIILLILHILSDFYFQTSKMAQNKKIKFRTLLLHSVIYSIPFFVFFTYIYINNQINSLISAFLVIAVSHCVIDLIKIKVENKFDNATQSLAIFVIDQVIHVTVILATCYSFNLGSLVANFNFQIANKSLSFNNCLIYLLIILIIANPTSIFIKKIFDTLLIDNKISSEEEAKLSNKVNAGRIIGVLERFITMILILANQYSVLGLVLTAKSIARFKNFDEKGFAEKYLTGTLISLSVAIAATLILKKFLI